MERDGQSVLTILQEILKPPVCVLGRAEAAELAHGPGFAAVHCRIDAARVRRLPRIAKVFLVVQFADVLRRMYAFYRYAGYGGEAVLVCNISGHATILGYGRNSCQS